MIKRSKQKSLRNMLKQIQTTSNLICKSLKELKLQSSTEYGIFTQAHSPPKQATPKNYKKISLYAKVIHKISFSLNSKITLKHLVSNHTLLTKVVDLYF
jgi:hypothetical protein